MFILQLNNAHLPFQKKIYQADIHRLKNNGIKNHMFCVVGERGIPPPAKFQPCCLMCTCAFDVALCALAHKILSYPHMHVRIRCCLMHMGA